MLLSFFFFNDTATTEIYTLSLHDALPICGLRADDQHAVDRGAHPRQQDLPDRERHPHRVEVRHGLRSEEHTSELQSRQYLVCRLLLEKKIRAITAISVMPPPMTTTMLPDD